jgi:hypothetical protein
MAYEVDRLEIVIQTATSKTNAALDKLITKLNKISKNLKQMQTFVTAVNNQASKTTVKTAGSAGAKKAKADYLALKKNILQADEALRRLNQQLMATPQFRQIMAENPQLSSKQGLDILKARNAQMGSAINLQRNLNNETERLNKINLEKSRKEFEKIKSEVIRTDSRVKSLVDKLKQTERYKSLMAQHPKLTEEQAVKILTATNSQVKRLNGQLVRTRGHVSTIRSIFIKITSALYVIRYLMKAINTAMDFGETINLFQTVFRKIGLDAGEEFEMAFLERADKFVTGFSEALTLDPEELMKYMANFAQMANSMSVTTESAYMLSESLTMLGADISSLFNIDIDDAMSKLKSGLAGQIRPMRQLGVDISKTSLQQIALKYGIEDSIETMSAAAKVQLRYLALMDQLKVTMGDMARTINTPANQLRILKQQWINLTRAVGQVFIPLVTKLLPILNAIVIALREMISSMAAAVGYEMPSFTDTDIFLGDISDEADEADESLQQLRNTLGGFDELNIIGMQTDGDDLLGSGYTELDEAIAKTYTDYLEQMNEQMALMQNKAKEMADSFKIILTLLTTYLATLAAIKVATIAVTVATNGWAASAALIGNKSLFAVAIASIVTLITLWDDLSTPMKVVLGLISAVTSAILIATNAVKILGVATAVWNAIAAANPIILIIIGIVAAVAAATYFIIKYWDDIVYGVTVAFDWIKKIAATTWAIVVNGVMGVVNTVITAFTRVKNFFVGMWDGLVDGLEAAWEFMKNIFGNVGNFFGKIGSGIGDVFKDLLNILIDGINWIIAQPFKAINSILSSIANVSIAGVEPFDFIQTIEIPQIPKLAMGGIVDYGQLFIAREAGAELVGNFGGSTGVMNNEQIVEAVSDGVYRAVMAAQSGNGKEFNVTVMLDGKQISSSVEQNRRRKGASILSGGNV